MPRFEPHKRALSRRVGPPFACTRHVSAMTNCGVAALPSAPAAALRRFVAPRAWDSCGDRFRKRWISLWALCAWAAQLSTPSCSAAAMPVASTPTAWCVSSPRCPRRSGTPSSNASAPMLNQISKLESSPVNCLAPALDKALKTPSRIGRTCRGQDDGGQPGAFL